METPAIVTLVKMMESLPEPAQNMVVEHLRAYIAEMQEEDTWNDAFQKSQAGLASAAKKARKLIKEGKAEPFNLDQL